MKIVAFSGSLRAGSYNSMLLRALKALAPEGMEIEILSVGELPLFNDDLVAEYPAPAQKLRDAVEAADGVILATPEYNRMSAAPLTNLLAWLTRPYPHNSFKGKPVLVCGVSSGKIGTAVAQSQLRHSLLYLEAEILGQPELYLGPAKDVFNEDGSLKEEKTREFLQKALAALQARVLR